MGRGSNAVRRYRRSLYESLDAERKAYGFTLAIWGGGAMVTAAHGAPGAAEAVCFVGGALVAMAAVIAATVGVRSDPGDPEVAGRLSLSGIHLLSVAGGIALAWAAGRFIAPAPAAFFVAGAGAALAYQMLLALESVLLGQGRRPKR